MTMFRIAVPASTWRQPLRRALQSVAATEVNGVQFDVRSEVTPEHFGDTARQQLRHYIEELGLKVAACTFATRGALVDPDRLDARVAAIREVLPFVRQLGAETLCVRLGTIPLLEQEAAYGRLQSVLADLASVGNRTGVTLAVSTLGNTAEQLRALLEVVDTGPVGVDFDPAGCVFGGVNPATALRGLHDCAAHIQIRDGLKTAEGAGVETAIGAGEISWDEFLATVAEADYRGWLTVRREGGADRTGDLARGVKFVRTVLLGG